MSNRVLGEIATEGKNALGRCQIPKKEKVFQRVFDEITDTFWSRFGKIKTIEFKGSNLEIVNDHCRALALMAETHRTILELNELVVDTTKEKKLLATRAQRLEWILEMKKALDVQVKSLDLRVEKGDPSRSKSNSLSASEIPELPISMEAPLLLLEAGIHKVRYSEAAEKFLHVSPQITDLHGLICTMQQKKVDETVMLLVFTDWLGTSLENLQVKPEWRKVQYFSNLERIVRSAFDSALTASWSALRRQYGVDLCDNFKLLSKSHELKRPVNFIMDPNKKKSSFIGSEMKDFGVQGKRFSQPVTSPVSFASKRSIEPINSPLYQSPAVEKREIQKPCPWKKHFDTNTNRHYYFHTESGKSQWTQPEDFWEMSKMEKPVIKHAPSLVSKVEFSTPKGKKISLRDNFKKTNSSMKIG